MFMDSKLLAYALKMASQELQHPGNTWKGRVMVASLIVMDLCIFHSAKAGGNGSGDGCLNDEVFFVKVFSFTFLIIIVVIINHHYWLMASVLGLQNDFKLQKSCHLLPWERAWALFQSLKENLNCSSVWALKPSENQHKGEIAKSRDIVMIEACWGRLWNAFIFSHRDLFLSLNSQDQFYKPKWYNIIKW